MTNRETGLRRAQNLFFVTLVIGASVLAAPVWAQTAPAVAASGAATAQAAGGGGIDAAEERKIAETVAASGAPVFRWRWWSMGS